VPGNLVAVALSGGAKGKEEEDRNMEAYARAYARQVFNCPDRTCVFTFTDYHALVTRLKTGPALEKLGILCHSAGGMLQLPVPDPEHPGFSVSQLMSMGQLAIELGPAHPRINLLEFLGCEVGSDPLAMWTFINATNIDKAVAHNFFHAFQPVLVPVKNETTEDTLKDDTLEGEGRGTLFNYLLPGTDLASIATKKGKSVQIWVEFFIRDDLSPNIFTKTRGERVKDCRPRQDPPGTLPGEGRGPNVEQIFAESDAVSAKVRLGKLYSEFSRIEVTK
jgi:hypothetical protein